MINKQKSFSPWLTTNKANNTPLARGDRSSNIMNLEEIELESLFV